jgi:hypothetical protein
MSITNPQEDHLDTPSYQSSKDSTNLGRKKRRAMGVEKRGTLEEMQSALLDQTKYGLEPRRDLRPG